MKRARPVRVGDAGAKGKGLFASRALRKSAVIGTFTGRPRWIWDIPEDVWPYTIQVDYDLYVVPRRNSSVWYVNHSCEPNCYITGSSVVVARDVAKGEELTFDYSSDVDWAGFRMPCHCGSPRCRGTVRAYRFLPERQRQRYGRHVAPYIQRKYLQGSRPVP